MYSVQALKTTGWDVTTVKNLHVLFISWLVCGVLVTLVPVKLMGTQDAVFSPAMLVVVTVMLYVTHSMTVVMIYLTHAHKVRLELQIIMT